MKVIRYQDAKGELGFARMQENGPPLALQYTGKGFAGTENPADVHKHLCPVDIQTIYCVGLNYMAHAAESGQAAPAYPMIFMKPISSLLAMGGEIVLPGKLASHKVDFEGELAVVIGKACRNVSRADALNYVTGYTIANDVSARDWQLDWGGGQFCKGKGFDTFCPIGPCLVTSDEISDPSGLQIVTRVNGDVMQDSSTSDMIFDVPTLIEFLSGSTTLLPGTVILTGTPAGVGHGRDPQFYLKAGDEVEITIERIGTLQNRVVEECI
jgi:2-keto-4-pentenoate hydratase/2-oxohepta-3-ene-1,7-dioic acid hydratase in catechol pathway